MELVRSLSFRSKRAFKAGMEEVRHFYPPCEYKYEFAEVEEAFPRPGRKHYAVDVFRRDHINTDFCRGWCDFFNHGICDRPEEE